MNKADPIKILISGIREVFAKPKFVAITFLGTIAIGVGIILLSNYQMIASVFAIDVFRWSVKFKILWTALGFYFTNFALSAQIMIALVALFSGINIAMLAFHFTKRANAGKPASTSGLGLIIGMLGAGCSACGSVILTSILGITSSSAIISALPLRGIEFGFLSLTLVGLSTYWLAKKIQEPQICKF